MAMAERALTGVQCVIDYSSPPYHHMINHLHRGPAEGSEFPGEEHGALTLLVNVNETQCSTTIRPGRQPGNKKLVCFSLQLRQMSMLPSFILRVRLDLPLRSFLFFRS